MQINFIPQRFYTPQAFKGRNTIERIENINHDYKVKSDYLSELKDEIRLSGGEFRRLNRNLERQREAEINYIAGEDFETGDDFLERLTY